MPDIPLAKQLMKDAVALCIETTATADRCADYVARREKIKSEALPITTSTEPLLADARSAIDAKFIDAEKYAALHEYGKANTQLDEARTEFEKADALQKADAAYVNELTRIKNAVKDLTKSKPPDSDPVIGAEITRINLTIDQADQAVAKPDYKYAEAMTLLVTADTDQRAAGVKKKMKGNTPPSEDELKDLMSQPGGTKLLDQIVEGLDSRTQQGVLLTAMKVRFGLDAATSIAAGRKGSDDVAELATTPDSDLSLKKIYTLLSKIPDKHTKDNPSLKSIKRYAGDSSKKDSKAKDKGDYYQETTKEVVLSLGRPDTSLHPLGDPDELPDVVDPDCQPVDKIPPSHFDNNTLHEAAHAIDDKKKFMSRNGGKAEYGGWTESASAMEAALAAAEAVKYDARFILKYLANPKNKDPEPQCPDGVKKSDWDAARDKAKAWADGVRHDNDPWEKGSLCSKDIAAGGFKIGDRIYHQAYKNTWVSYLAASRAQGVTGYQFRAPGEWFSELYAAYGMRKLKKSHPAVKLFLEKMFPLNPPLT